MEFSVQLTRFIFDCFYVANQWKLRAELSTRTPTSLFGILPLYNLMVGTTIWEYHLRL